MMSEAGGTGRGDHTSRSGEGAASVPPTRSRRVWLAAGVMAVALAAAAFFLVPRGSASPAVSPSPAATSADSSSSPQPTGSPAATDSSEPPDPDAGDVAPEAPAVSPLVPAQAEGISVALTKFESVTGEVVVPGEVQAAAVRVTVDITNTGDAALDLNLVVTNAYMGDTRDPAETYQQPGGAPVSGSLAPGESAQGVYLFRIPEDRRADVTFVVDYRAGQPALTWRGPIPPS